MNCNKGINIEQRSIWDQWMLFIKNEKKNWIEWWQLHWLLFFLICQVNRIEGRSIRAKWTLHSSRIQSCKFRNSHLGKFVSHSSNFHPFFTFHRLIDDQEKESASRRNKLMKIHSGSDFIIFQFVEHCLHHVLNKQHGIPHEFYKNK